jgi:hypothetical protein
MVYFQAFRESQFGLPGAQFSFGSLVSLLVLMLAKVEWIPC